jgi:cytochrome c oxidase subunit 2
VAANKHEDWRSMQRSLKHIRLLATLLIALVLGLGSASTALAVQPGGITDEAHEMHDLFLVMLYFSIALFVIIAGALVYAIIRYRRKNDELPKQVHGSNRVEILWTGIPIIIVIVLFTLSLITLASVEKKAEQNALTIEVTGFQYQWKFVYDLNDLGEGEFAEDGYITIIGTPANEPELVLPVDEVVEFNLQSTDVIHSFYVRDFLYKLDLIPGRINQFSVTPRETGVFRAQCAELCGVNHSLMRFTVRIVEREEFDIWIRETVKHLQNDQDNKETVHANERNK